MKKTHDFCYRFFRPLVILFLFFALGYRYKKAKGLPENYIVIANHATDFDPLLVGAGFSRPMYFVGSEHIARWGWISRFLKFAFDPIARTKGAPATTAVLEMLRRVKRGANACIFAEGVRTWDGRTCPILPSTAKLVKSAGCGLVTFKLVGGYFTSPMWGGASIRRGELRGQVANVYTKEQLRTMSVDEVYAAITNDLAEDAYQRQLESPKRYRSRCPAEGMEKLLFICPQCGGKDTFTSSGDRVRCGSCGLEFQYDEFGMLHGLPFQTVRELSDWQKLQVRQDVASGAVYTAGDASLGTVSRHEATPVTQGPLTLSREGLKCGDEEFPLEEISDLAMHGQNAIVFTVHQKYYELIPAKGFNALKFQLFFDEYRDQITEKVR